MKIIITALSLLFTFGASAQEGAVSSSYLRSAIFTTDRAATVNFYHGRLRPY